MALCITISKHRSLTRSSLIYLFSTSSSSITPPSGQSTPQNDTNSQFQQHQQQQFSFSSQFSDVKASLKRQRQNPQYQDQPNKPNFPPLRKPSNSETKASSFEEIRKNLAEFRHRSTVPPPTDSSTAGPPSYSSQQQQISFQELYNRSRLGKSEDGHGSNESTLNSKNTPISGNLSFERIRESLQQLRHNDSSNRGRGREPFSAFKGSLNLKPANEFEPTKSSVIGGTRGLPLPVSRKEDASGKAGISTEFVKMYDYGQLGAKLRSLRPEVKEGEKGWFSLEELNERLRKLRELEEKERGLRMPGLSFRDLRESLVELKKSGEKAKQSSSHLLGQRGALSFMMHPPKEHLVEKYFHPDNMSSAEKLKIDLAKVREEFKMSESDCGSARVQVAQLTTKIKHLSSVLHKKDKHSRKGLQEMVQRRKKLLKYMRRTDWDSYCLVLSKLGLRDNPDLKS